MAVDSVFKLSITIFALLVWGIAVNVLLPLHSVHLHVLSQQVPLPGPDLRRCGEQSPCCLQVPKKGAVPLEFKRNSSIPVRRRRSAKTALQSPAYLRKLKMAYRKMRDLQHSNPEDPRGMEQQRLVHCVYCSSGLAYGPEYEVHGNWFFLPWHRMYLYFHERILAAMVGDPHFRLLFWNWDSLSGREFPFLFRPRSSPLFDLNRNHDARRLRALVRNATTREMLRSTIAEAETHELFLGRPLGSAQGGLIETGSHNAIHTAVGKQTPPFHNMGNLSWASGDPVFFAHHANVDRLWWVWSRLPTATTARRSNPPDTAWRDSRFVFYDENAVLTSISVKDVLDTKRNLRYKYEDVENDWLPTGRKSRSSPRGNSSQASMWPIVLRSVAPARTRGDPVDCPLVARTRRVSSAPVAAVGIPVAILESFHLSCRSPFCFDVYLLGTDRDSDKTTTRLHYVSSFYSFPASGSHSGLTRTIKFPIKDVLGSDLDRGGKVNWTVRIVPHELGAQPTGNVSLLLPSVRIEWLLPTARKRHQRRPRSRRGAPQ